MRGRIPPRWVACFAGRRLRWRFMFIPERLRSTCEEAPEHMAWLERLPGTVHQLISSWRLTLGSTVDHDGCASWVAEVTRNDGTAAVLKVGLPHFEAEHEIDALELLKGDPTVLLLGADRVHNAMLLERCDPDGYLLDREPASQHAEILAGLLRRFWQAPVDDQPFRPLSEMTAAWSRETLDKPESWIDGGLVREGLRLFEELPRTAHRHVLLHTDLHAKNVLSGDREPWLVIDPKPFIGDPAYDATQHLVRVCREQMASEQKRAIARFADLLQLDRDRVRLWVFARAAAEASRIRDFIDVARSLAP